MRPLFTLVKREFAAYFLSPIAYVASAVFLIVTGYLFSLTLGQLTETGPRGIEYPMQGLLGGKEFWLIFLTIPPLLTMRLIAEERGTGTLEMLLTAPIRDWQVVAGKYIGSLMFYVVLWLPTLAAVPVLIDLHRDAEGAFVAGIDPWPVVTSYVGVFFAGAMFLAIGLLVSSLVKSQLVAALIATCASLVFVATAFGAQDLAVESWWGKLVTFLSVPNHFRTDFTRGILDTRHLVLYASVAACCLFLTVVSLETRRLRA